MPKAKNVTPIFQSPSGRFYLWARIAGHARRHPNTWLFVLGNVPAATVRAVREQRHPDLRLPSGTLQAQGRNQYRDQDGRRMADLFVRYVPEGDTP